MEVGGQRRTPSRGGGDEHAEHRILLLRHRGGDPAAGSRRLGQFGEFRPRQQQHVLGNRAQRIRQAGQASPNLVMGARWFCHGTAGTASPRELGDAPGEFQSGAAGAQHGERRECSAGTAPLHGKLGAGQPAGRADESVQPAGGLQPERRGDAVLGERARDHERRAVPIRQRGERVDRH